MASDEETSSAVRDGEQISASTTQDTIESSKKRLSYEMSSNDEREEEPTVKRQRTGSIERPPSPIQSPMQISISTPPTEKPSTPSQESTSTPTVEAAVKEVVEEAIQEAEAEADAKPNTTKEIESDAAPEIEQEMERDPQEEERPQLVMEEPVYPDVDTTPSYDDDYALQVRRSIALALEHVGFNGATKEAMESFAGEVDAYISRLMSLITKSALISRRSIPIPLDYEYGLVRMGLTSASLRPHLKPPIPVHKSQPTYTDPEPEPPAPISTTALLGPELEGASDKSALRYIPKSFPAFPSKHTYKATPHLAAREKDPRKIREKATETARYGEEALRRLVNNGSSGTVGGRKRGKKSLRARERQEMWEKTMKELMKGQAVEDAGVIVNAEKPYWRQGSAPSRKAPPAAAPEKSNEKI